MKVQKFALVLVLLAACSSEKDTLQPWQPWQTGRTKMLIIGDSISMGYTPFVRERLAPAVQVQHGGGDYINDQSSRETRNSVDAWLVGLESGDTITWNNGLHEALRDAYPLPQDRISLDEYRDNLHAIAQKLLATPARVFFLTTTYVPANIDFPPAIQKRADLNVVARDVMQDYPNITVVDLGTYSETITSLMTNAPLQNNVHYTDAGYDALAQFIVNAVWEKGDGSN